MTERTCYSEMTLPAEILESSKFVVAVDRRENHVLKEKSQNW